MFNQISIYLPVVIRYLRSSSTTCRCYETIERIRLLITFRIQLNQSLRTKATKRERERKGERGEANLTELG